MSAFSRAACAVFGFALAALSLRSNEPAVSLDQRVENLAAFARVYGYVRFFHPSDDAAIADWDRVGIVGAEAVHDAGDAATLRRLLLEQFRPLAPTLHLEETAPTATSAPIPALPSSGDGEFLTFWQREGLNLSGEPGPYRGSRVITGRTVGARMPLFQPASAPGEFTALIAPGLSLRLKLALPVTAENLTASASVAEHTAFEEKLAAVPLATLTASDWRLRAAGVITVWNVFQHFHPYLTSSGIAWDEALRPALRRVLQDKSEEDYYATLSELVAKTNDGHGYIYVTGRRREAGALPFRVTLAEDRIVVTAAPEGSPLRRGDLIEAIDGVAARDVLANRERYVAGSPQLRRFRALNSYSEGPLDSTARIAFTRGGERQETELTRTREHLSFFFHPMADFPLAPFAELRPGIFYVNLQSIDLATYEAKLPDLAAAKAVIFDWRLEGRPTGDRNTKRPSVHNDIISHLTAETVHASPMLVPRVTRPDRADWTYRESSWPVAPKSPRLQGRIFWINEPSVVSYGETCMAMIAHHHLATLVGAPTAGTNGNVSFIPLPGGFRVMWTAMDVRRMDRTPFYGVGFVPDIPVKRTIAGILAGRDEYLEAALAAAEAATL